MKGEKKKPKRKALRNEVNHDATDLHGVWLPPPHEEVVVADAQVEDQLVHSQFSGVKGEVVAGFVHSLDYELLVVKTYVPDF